VVLTTLFLGKEGSDRVSKVSRSLMTGSTTSSGGAANGILELRSSCVSWKRHCRQDTLELAEMNVSKDWSVAVVERMAVHVVIITRYGSAL